MVDSMPEKARVAAVQASPVFMDKEATIDKACRLIEEAGRNGAELIVFPETFIPAYPSSWTVGWETESTSVAKAHIDLQDNSLVIPSDDCVVLGDAAKSAHAYVVMGCNELDCRAGSRTLYNTLLFIGREGEILGKHRKVVPTYAERLYHGRGDGSDIRVYETEIGCIGGLICYEHHMPLIKAALMMQGEEIHAAVWPGHWGGGDSGESGNLPGFDINKCDITPATREYAMEAQCFVVSANMILTVDQVPDDFPFKENMPTSDGGFILYHCGGSHIVGPFSNFLVEPVFGEEKIIYADCESKERKEAKITLDLLGHYSRWDIARLDFKAELLEPFTSKINEEIWEKPEFGKIDSTYERFEASIDKIEKLIKQLLSAHAREKKN